MARRVGRARPVVRPRGARGAERRVRPRRPPAPRLATAPAARASCAPPPRLVALAPRLVEDRGSTGGQGMPDFAPAPARPAGERRAPADTPPSLPSTSFPSAGAPADALAGTTGGRAPAPRRARPSIARRVTRARAVAAAKRLSQTHRADLLEQAFVERVRGLWPRELKVADAVGRHPDLDRVERLARGHRIRYVSAETRRAAGRRGGGGRTTAGNRATERRVGGGSRRRISERGTRCGAGEVRAERQVCARCWSPQLFFSARRKTRPIWTRVQPLDSRAAMSRASRGAWPTG